MGRILDDSSEGASARFGEGAVLAGVIAKQAESGLSVRAWCLRRELGK